MKTNNTIHKTLKDYFGYEKFRPLQETIIKSILDGNDNLVIMPTGGGKSICFQLPALLLKGVTLVISPLIALMKDQVDGMNANGIPAAYLNSSQTQTENQSILGKIANGEVKLLYLAPESLALFENLLAQITISLIAIDEAHCISSWGHDFRPAYTQLGFLKKRLPNTPIIALTATADKATREDIVKQLNIPKASRHIASFDRPNIFLEVRAAQDRISQIVQFIEERPNSAGIIYCLSRKATEQVAARLEKQGFKAKAYHAGLPHEERSKIQEDFIYDKSTIVCATIAFGMGIDKSNVRWVIHYNLPKNMEGYYQEIGRSGRDGLQAETILFYSYADVIQLQKFAENSGNKEVQLSKLERMQQYTEALSCRRKILLSYFGEFLEEDCGACDVCKNPPSFFDGTIVAQKILSGIYRLKEQEPIGTLVDFLRGSQNSAIYDKGYQNLKTYGIIKDISWRDLQQYIIQTINLGYCEIAFHENNALKFSELSKKVLFENEKVRFTKIAPKLKTIKEKTVTKKKKVKDTLFERLRLLRLNIAQQKNIPAYHVFTDASLKQMEKERPMTDEDFLAIEGVGRKKFEDFGYQFIKEISAFQKDKTKIKKSRPSKGATYKETFKLHLKGLSTEEIALERKLSLMTIQAHFIKLFQEGYEIDLSEFVDPKEVALIAVAKKKLNNPTGLKPYFEYFEEQMSYETIKFSLAILEKK
ncbi:DNA helicase RecQ [uncultured Polaribacter sp.]|uniref:DNA helicase RecQ n=1 Tax=uncultured Polaribacter sp. TaxID=174711 RepID=UPI00262BA594|nr:DNA helicase RecQ [uncultured Polaribacter sp.]